jgi:hypothetical protein
MWPSDAETAGYRLNLRELLEKLRQSRLDRTLPGVKNEML